MVQNAVSYDAEDLVTKLSNTPLYSTFLRIELLLEAEKPQEALRFLEKELNTYDADAYLRCVRSAYHKQAGMPDSYHDEVEAAWCDYEGDLNDIFQPGDDRLEPTPAQQEKIKSLRSIREGRLQAVWEMHKAALVPQQEEVACSLL